MLRPHMIKVRCWLSLAALCCVLAMQSSADAASVYSNLIISRTNPTIYWDLDETSGTLANDTAPISGFTAGNHLPTSSSTGVGPRPVDGFINMNPTNDGSTITTSGKVRVDTLGSVGISTSAYSMGLWFNSSASFTSQALNYVMERGSSTGTSGRRDAVGVGGTFGSGTTNRLFATASGTLLTSTYDMTPNTWYYVTLVRDDSLPTEKLKVYLDGNTTPIITDNAAWGGGLGDYFAAGNRTDANPSLGLNGTMDEVAIWNRALTSEEVLFNYQAAVLDVDVLFPVPEPSSAVLLGLGALICLRRRRR